MDLKPVNTYDKIKEIVIALGGQPKLEGLNYILQDYLLVLVSNLTLYIVPQNKPLKHYVKKFEITEYMSEKKNHFGTPYLDIDSELLKKDLQSFLYSKRFTEIDKDFDDDEDN